jgi:hypothetical protein
MHFLVKHIQHDKNSWQNHGELKVITLLLALWPDCVNSVVSLLNETAENEKFIVLRNDCHFDRHRLQGKQMLQSTSD